MIEPFQATFAVPLTCESCIKDVSKPLYELAGIKKVDANLADQLIMVEGTAAPSAIVAAIQGTGRDAILRGSGTSNNASVCILETHREDVANKIRGLVRMVQVSGNLTIFDLTINGLSPGRYWATIRETGDISRGPESTGGVWEAVKELKEQQQQSNHNDDKSRKDSEPRGVVGSVDVDEHGKGSVFLDRPIAVWEMIGRSMVVSRQREGPFSVDDEDTIVGVVARSAGVWDNEKMVCSCSGKNVWEERREQLSRGIV
ncbi:superoxide dismutase 1 copper chaperone [Nannizzia gypsea CBS 118893]|uniref:Superoxide dismutase 1 copper chaperone n=1 Tax=Arthroderma gypseum (strain ATCC MYA-4604 / CBS 118893) TaxID=535722 RepID=E4V557_ARTGP|nr:superoxide dismutase 1 copper chaperone [Nannizzia gypsea CBS 118893]EFR05131.1 superoxide dismutase 1 copper chaperone [Nannizzia gypsea CBS 118893]